MSGWVSHVSKGYFQCLGRHTHERNFSRETDKLIITKPDRVNYIVSSTFWYDIEDYNRVIHKIREGRFGSGQLYLSAAFWFDIKDDEGVGTRYGTVGLLCYTINKTPLKQA